jgi:2-C-methyl-D-erythritol 4-phosphate cytidylyltransferase
LAQKDADFAKREVSLRKSQRALAKAREAIDDEVAKRLQIERVSITESEKKKARIALAADLKQRDRVLAELQATLTPTMQN